MTLLLLGGLLEVIAVTAFVEEAVDLSRCLCVCWNRPVSFMRASSGIEGARGGHMPMLGRQRRLLRGALFRWHGKLKDGTHVVFDVYQHGQLLLVEPTAGTRGSTPMLARSSWNEWRFQDASSPHPLPQPLGLTYMTPSRLRVENWYCSLAPKSKTIDSALMTTVGVGDGGNSEFVLSLDMTPATKRFLLALSLLILPVLAAVTVAIGHRWFEALCLLTLAVFAMTTSLCPCLLRQFAALTSRGRLFFVALPPLMCALSLCVVANKFEDSPELSGRLWAEGGLGFLSALCSTGVLFFESDCFGFLVANALDLVVSLTCFVLGTAASSRRELEAVAKSDPEASLLFQDGLSVEDFVSIQVANVVALILLAAWGAVRLLASVALHPYMQPLRAPQVGVWSPSAMAAKKW